jgi:hypothetical protein
VNDSLDLADNPRIYNGVRVDMGAYEFQGVPASFVTDYITACGSYTWINGITYTSNNNTATHTLTSSEGCDSLVTLNLTVLNNKSTDSIKACGSYTWIDGITYTANNNTATYTLTNSLGCDSLITLHLTIKPIPHTRDIITAHEQYTWIDDITYTSNNSTATYTYTNSFGCDSVVTLNLTIFTSATKYVKEGATGNGSSWNNSSGDLQYMINQTSPGGEVWVAKGTYKPIRRAHTTDTITPNNRDNAFVIKTGVRVYGGFDGTETTLSKRNFHENISILSGNLGDTLITDDNAYHVVVCAGNLVIAVLDGFTIKDGNANGTGNISVSGDSLSRGSGGGISVINTFASPRLSNLTVKDNKASANGGGISILFSLPIITNCIFSGNEAGTEGGGIYLSLSPINIINTIINGNKSGSGSGIFAFYSSSLNLVNVTISGNTNFGMVNFNTSPQIKNSIIYGNGSGGMRGGNPTYFNSLVQGLNNSTNGNISGSTNPLFINAPNYNSAPFTNGDYRLSPCSPVINAGNNSYLGANDTTDVAGKARRHNLSLVDMGAYETSPYQLQEIASTTLESTLSCNKDDGWIHYYNDHQEKILLSIHPHGQDLGTVNVSSVLTDNYDLLAAPLQAPFGQDKTIIPFNRSWSVNAENEFEQPVSVRFYFSAEDSSDIARTLGFQHLSELQVYKVNGMDAWDENASGYVSYSYDAIPDTAHFSLGTYDGIQYAEFQVLSFSSGTMAMVVDDAVLPLDLLSFTAAALEDKTYLQWHTVNEENVSHFEIERSIDARNWQTISSVSALNGLEQHYNVLDESPNNGNNYYRLKMVDFDGTYKYSKIVEITFGNSALSPQYFIYPNPNNGVFIIQASNIQNELINIELFDGLGRKVFGDKIIQGLNEIQLNHLTSGMYYLYFNNSQGKTIHKIVIDSGE